MITTQLKRLKDIVRKYGFFGNYKSWSEATSNSIGYDSQHILNKVRESLQKVKNDEAAFERDSVAFDKPEYIWPVLSSLLWIASQRKEKLHILDFGGSLGSLYFQHRTFLQHLDLRWNIVEQENFVTCGKQEFEDNQLKFYSTLDECFSKNEIDVVILSSVLPYIAEPYDLLNSIIRYNPDFIIFNKMPFLTYGNTDRLTVQRVNPAIYDASYPAWFFNEAKFLSFLEPQYKIVSEFPCSDVANVPSTIKGLLVSRKHK